MLPLPLDLSSWLVEHADKLRPPVNNYVLQKGSDFLVMAVGGPNRRSDYHINETEEWFYQVKGDMLLKVVDGKEFRDIVIKEGQLFLLPGNTPHNPVRFADTVGIVIERSRPEGSIDRLRWYCENETCKTIVFEESFHCTDLGVQLKPVIEKYYAHESLRTCQHCKHVNGIPSQ